MCLLFETIKVENKKICNVDYHNARMNYSRRELFNSRNEIDLNEVIIIPQSFTDGIYKCRIIYSKNIHSIEFLPYVYRKIQCLQIIIDDEISYSYKFQDRIKLTNHLSKVTSDEILIVKNGLITDTSYSNVVFKDERRFITPSKPLLRGTKRAQLINESIISEEEIHLDDLSKFKFVYLINAMLELDEANGIPIDKIIE